MLYIIGISETNFAKRTIVLETVILTSTPELKFQVQFEDYGMAKNYKNII